MNEKSIAIVQQLTPEEAYNDMVFGEPNPAPNLSPQIKEDVCHYTGVHNCKYWNFGCYSPEWPCEFMNERTENADS